MRQRTRIVALIAALTVAGAAVGVLGGLVAVAAATLIYLHALPGAALLVPGMRLGAGMGAVGLPALGWIALRTVPLRAAVLGTSVGTALGGMIGLLAGAAAVNPYVPLTVSRPPFPQCAVGMAVGAMVAAGGLRAIVRRRPEVESMSAG